MKSAQIDRRTLLKGGLAGAGALALGGLAAPAAHAADWKVLPFTYQAQQTGYWCGPTATAIALSCRGITVSQQEMANELGTTVDGTNWIGQVTSVLDNYVGWYQTKEMPNDPPTQAQKDLLWQDITFNVDHGYALVANIVAPPGNQPPGYPSDQTIYHYFTVVGYNPDLMQAYIADPADFSGNQTYWLSFDQLASLIPPKGYSA
ncbi:C39 family peptidase [Flexivirga caeni]|uniref:Lysis protein n=1 Tax=Flexivirga caeni TaxID=2294115 RepID=A0A3M9LYX0_9MICO|nr:C39 family peptidase [Flexivirga caeni]RNI18422.1 lysis protein [Flexivirga caeni]